MKLEIVPRDKKIVESTKKIVEDALKADYESVIIFGYKDGMVQITAGDCRSVLEIVGALEAAKCMLLNQGGYAE